MKPIVIAVSLSSAHTSSKPNVSSITLIAGFGVEGDAHAGELVKHRYLVGIDATRPNIRQVHLMQAELFDEVAEKGFDVKQFFADFRIGNLWLFCLSAGS